MTAVVTQRITIGVVRLKRVLSMVFCLVSCLKRGFAIAHQQLLPLCCAGLLGVIVGIMGPLVPPAQAADLSPAPESATAYIISPSNGEAVSSPFVVQFGLSGMGIAPAGVDRPNTGHHHLLIDVDELPSLTEPLQGSEQVLHYGAGQTETELSLAPGEHTLQLVLGNYSHIPHEHPVISEPITVKVQ